MGIVLLFGIFLQPTIWVTIDNQDFENTFYHKYEAVLSSLMFTLTKKACKNNQFLFLLTLPWWHTCSQWNFQWTQSSEKHYFRANFYIHGRLLCHCLSINKSWKRRSIHVKMWMSLICFLASGSKVELKDWSRLLTKPIQSLHRCVDSDWFSLVNMSTTWKESMWIAW